MRTHETNKGPRAFPVLRKAFTVTAQSDRLAIDQANKALARFLGKGPVWSDKAWNWTFARAQRVAAEGR